MNASLMESICNHVLDMSVEYAVRAVEEYNDDYAVYPDEDKYLYLGHPLIAIT